MLSKADLQRGLAVLGAISEQAADAGAFAQASVRELPRLVACELATLSVCHLQTGHREVIGFPDARLSADDRRIFDRFFAEHPLVRFHAGRRGRGAHRISDSLPFARFRQGALYHEYYRRIGIDHVVALPVLVDDDVLVSFVLNRVGRDFGARDCERLDCVGPVLSRLYQQLRGPGIAATGADHRLDALTPRERMVLRWVAAGKTDRDVGSILGCSHRTVQKHLQRISSTKSLASRPGRRRPCAAVPPAVPKRPDSSRTLPRDNRRACSTR